MDGTALVVCDGLFATANAKTAHGLVRGTERYRIRGRDRRADRRPRRRRGARRPAPRHPGLRLDRGRARRAAAKPGLLRGRRRDLRRPASRRACARCSPRRSTPACRSSTASTSSPRRIPGLAARRGATAGVTIHDVRRAPAALAAALLERGDPVGPRAAAGGPRHRLRRRASARPPASCATPAARAGLRTELDLHGPDRLDAGRARTDSSSTRSRTTSSPGELEHAIVSCWEEAHPDLILLEGQSSLRNPSGPCGSEFLLSGGARGVILQHAPGRASTSTATRSSACGSPRSRARSR